MSSEMVVFLPFVFLFGITVGSFLNVCIYRIPLEEEIVHTHSHCMSCGSKLKWYDLIPVFSWLFLGGKCRRCGERISIQYPLIELGNGILWVLAVARFGLTFTSLWYAVSISSLIVLSLIDWRTYEIPFCCNLWILAMGAGNLVTEVLKFGFGTVPQYLIGAVCVSGFLELLIIATKGRAMGGGDVKLMFAAGLLLGWKRILLAFVVGCITGSVVHPIMMKWKNKDRVLAFGPYLSFGIWISMMWGQQIVDWYIHYLFG